MRTASWVLLLQSQAFSSLVFGPFSPTPTPNHRFITSFSPITFKQHLPVDEVCSYTQLPVKLCCLISKDERESFIAEAEACLSVRGGLYPSPAPAAASGALDWAGATTSPAVQTNGTQPLSKTWEHSLYELE